MNRTIVNKSDVMKGIHKLPVKDSVFFANYYLVQASLKTQEETRHNAAGLRAHLEEICTVKAKGPRGSGHTTTIHNLATYFYRPVIMAKTVEHLRTITMDNTLSPGDEKRGILYVTQPNQLMGKKFDYIAVDCASIRERTEEDFLKHLYDVCTSCMNSYAYRIILLSE